MQCLWNKIRIKRSYLLFGISFTFYCLWQIYWLWHKKIPPSIFEKLTGIPCPTSGGCRSIDMYCQGNFVEGFLWNPMSLIFIVLFIISVLSICNKIIKKDKLYLNKFIVYAWFYSLLIGWFFKFLIGDKYW